MSSKYIQSKNTTNGIFVLFCLLFHSLPIRCEPAVYPTVNQINMGINQLYNQIQQQPKQELSDRIEHISGQLLGRPYELGALGEGEEGYFDKAPLYRLDAFDCETFVDTVLALAFAHNLTTFQYIIRQVRYDKGLVSFISRNHFVSLDWNPHNHHNGFLKDITPTIKDSKHRTVAIEAHALINKPAWYQHFTITKIRLNQKASLSEQQRRLTLLQHKGQTLPKTVATIPYLPLNVLFDSKNQPNAALFKQIPNAAIIEIVRPNWDLTPQIGTHLNVSHLGFAIWKNKILYFREASSLKGKLIDTPLITYLQQMMQTSSTIKGINIQVALPQEYSF